MNELLWLWLYRNVPLARRFADAYCKRERGLSLAEMLRVRDTMRKRKLGEAGEE